MNKAMKPTLYRRFLALAASPHAEWWLALTAFAEASFFPIPVDVLLVPMMLARRDRIWRLAAICTVFSVSGAVFGWALGAFLMEHVGLPIARLYHAEARITALEEAFRRYGAWIILGKGLTPIPFKLVTLSAGAARYPLLPFVLACIVTRGGRFFLEGTLLRAFGAPMAEFIERRLKLLLLAVLVAVVGGVLLVEFL